MQRWLLRACLLVPWAGRGSRGIVEQDDFGAVGEEEDVPDGDVCGAICECDGADGQMRELTSYFTDVVLCEGGGVRDDLLGVSRLCREVQSWAALCPACDRCGDEKESESKVLDDIGVVAEGDICGKMAMVPKTRKATKVMIVKR